MSTPTSSQTGCILHRKAGTYPPNDLLERILKENPTAWGAATVNEGALQINSEATPTTLKELQATFEALPDTDITFYFCNSPTALSTKDMSPYILVATPSAEDPEEENPQIVAFIRGNFPAHVKAGSSHPPEYHLVNDVLMPKFDGLYEMADGDLDKIMTNLMKPHFKKEMLLNSVAEGTITVVAANGVSMTFDQGDTGKEFPWGWVSDTYGYGEEKVEAPKPEKKKGLFSRSTVREAAPKPPITTAVEPPKTDTTVIKNYSVKKWAPQAHYSRKDRKNAYKMRIGYAPKGWENNIEVDVYVGPDNKIMTFAEVKALGPQALGVIQLAKNPEKEKDYDAAGVKHGDTLPAESPQVTTDILPIMSPKSREGVNDIRNKDNYKKIISENAVVISDPKQAEGFETKFVDFAKQMGAKTMQEFACWDFEMRYNLAKTNPQAAAVMLDTFTNICIRAGLFKDQVIAEKEEAPPVKRGGLFKRAS